MFHGVNHREIEQLIHPHKTKQTNPDPGALCQKQTTRSKMNVTSSQAHVVMIILLGFDIVCKETLCEPGDVPPFADGSFASTHLSPEQRLHSACGTEAS